MVPNRTHSSLEGVKFEIQTQKAQFERFCNNCNLKNKKWGGSCFGRSGGDDYQVYFLGGLINFYFQFALIALSATYIIVTKHYGVRITVLHVCHFSAMLQNVT